jgi:hypothetical protein
MNEKASNDNKGELSVILFSSFIINHQEDTGVVEFLKTHKFQT